LKKEVVVVVVGPWTLQDDMVVVVAVEVVHLMEEELEAVYLYQ
jgi:hypothetical protein